METTYYVPPEEVLKAKLSAVKAWLEDGSPDPYDNTSHEVDFLHHHQDEVENLIFGSGGRLEPVTDVLDSGRERKIWQTIYPGITYQEITITRGTPKLPEKVTLFKGLIRKTSTN